MGMTRHLFGLVPKGSQPVHVLGCVLQKIHSIGLMDKQQEPMDSHGGLPLMEDLHCQMAPSMLGELETVLNNIYTWPGFVHGQIDDQWCLDVGGPPNKMYACGKLAA
ncbi:unnamed protein product [Caenorhabditis nigoni]